VDPFVLAGHHLHPEEGALLWGEVLHQRLQVVRLMEQLLGLQVRGQFALPLEPLLQDPELLQLQEKKPLFPDLQRPNRIRIWK
jgi:hypothetical protein